MLLRGPEAKPRAPTPRMLREAEFDNRNIRYGQCGQPSVSVIGVGVAADQGTIGLGITTRTHRAGRGRQNTLERLPKMLNREHPRRFKLPAEETT